MLCGEGVLSWGVWSEGARQREVEEQKEKWRARSSKETWLRSREEREMVEMQVGFCEK